jgi:multidrug efflux system outer membrane protein
MNKKNIPCVPGVRLTVLMGAVLWLSGCALTPYQSERPAVQVPASWQEPGASAAAPAEQWWRDFSAAELNALMQQALRDSPDMAVAAQRVVQAEAAMQVAGASLFPSLSLSGSSTAKRVVQGSNSQSSSAAVAVGYELDLWGKLDAGVRAADASLDGSRYDLETARLTLTSGVANAYFQVLALRERLAVARQNLQLAESLMAIVSVKFKHGAASALDVSQQQTTVLTQRSALIPLEVQVRQGLTALAVLIGRHPEGFDVQGAPLMGLSLPQVGVSLPGEVLARRPDLAKAEASWRAADANVDAARAALLPTLSLTSTGTLSTSNFLALGDPTKTLAFTGSLAQSLFDGGKLRAQVDSQKAQALQAQETYRKTVLTALKEVEDALSNVGRYRDQEQAQMAIRDEAQRSLDLSQRRYRAGADGLSAVIDAQRTLYSAQDQLVQYRLSRLGAAVDLVKVLGGGWVGDARATAPLADAKGKS